MIRKRKAKDGSYRFQVRLSRKGMSEISKTFITRRDAEQWEREQIIALDQTALRHKPLDLASKTLRQLIDKYRITHLPHKKGCLTEQSVLDYLCRTESFVDQPLSTLTPETFTTYKNNRLTIDKIKPSTFMRQFCIIQHIFEVSIKEWGLEMDNPCRMIQKPKIDNQRDRLPTDREHQMIMNSAGYELRRLYELLRETALRKSELLAIKPEHIRGQTLYVPEQKTKQRLIPLTERAEEILKTELKPPFKISVSGFSQRWKRLMRKLQIDDLHIHDMRHFSLSRFAKMPNMSSSHLMVISGHSNLKMLSRYVNLKADDVLEIIRPEKENVKVVK